MVLEKFEDAKEVIRSYKTKGIRQYNKGDIVIMENEKAVMQIT